MMLFLAVLAIFCFNYKQVTSLNNGLALTPPMGWLQWERFRCNVDCKKFPDSCVSEKLFKDMADRMEADGYKEAGYEYINIDDCWPEKSRDKDGNLVPDRERFPGGMASLADYVHSKGLKLGIYTDMGTKTCAGYPASMFYMQKDTEAFAKWGIDMVKVDGCYSAYTLFDEGYSTFGWYLNQTGRHILYSNEWPLYLPSSVKRDYQKIAKTCNMWRNYGDVQDSWGSVLDIINYNGDHQNDIISAVGPGQWNDPDMLIVGDYSLSEDQSKAQFALWSIMAAPLFMSTDLRTIKPWQKAIILNTEVIAVNQDKLGKMGRRIYKDNSKQIWAKQLENDSLSVVILSTRTDEPIFMDFSFSQVGWKAAAASIRDLYEHKDLGTFKGSFSAIVNPSGVIMHTVNLWDPYTIEKKPLKRIAWHLHEFTFVLPGLSKYLKNTVDKRSIWNYKTNGQLFQEI